MRGRVTLRSVASLKPGERSAKFLWDEALPGFGIRVTPAGVVSYVFQYEQAARSRRLTIGRHGAPWTPATARREAIRLRADVAAGRDPAELRAEAHRAATLTEFSERYLAEHARPKKKPSSATEDARLLRNHILPALGRRKLASLARPEVARLHHSMRSTPFAANRVLALLSKMFNLAEGWGLRPDGSNPCRHVERFKERRRERFLSFAELAKLGQVLGEIERGGSEPSIAVAAIRLLLFTGCRRSEVLTLRWDEVDLERGRLTLRDSKTGPKVVRLGAPALRVLAQLPRFDESPYCFAGRHGRGCFVGLPHIWERIRARAGLQDVRLHDLRHSFASVGAGSGESLVIIGALLGHRQPATTSRYAHLADDPVRRAADRIAETIASAMNGEQPPGNVHPITTRLRPAGDLVSPARRSSFVTA